MQSALQNKDLAFQVTGVQPHFPQSSSKWDFWQKVVALTHQPPAQALSGGYKKKNSAFESVKLSLVPPELFSPFLQDSILA